MVQPRRERASVRDPYSTKHSSNSGRRIPHADKVDRDDPNRTDILITLRRFELAGIEIDERAVDIAGKLTRWHLANSEEQSRKHQEEMAARVAAAQVRECWVYYVRCGRLIKIGMTTNLANRFSSIRPNEVLAIEPGGLELEAEMHKQFAELRAERRVLPSRGRAPAARERGPGYSRAAEVDSIRRSRRRRLVP